MKIKLFTIEAIKAALKRSYSQVKNSSGFTLVEVLVALGIGLVLLAALYNLFTIQNKTFNNQELIVEMQQNTRAAMDMMVAEIRMAGYDPAALNGLGIYDPTAHSISFKQDLNGNSTLNGSDDHNENITYNYNSGVLRITRDTHAGNGARAFAENIEALNFYYNDNDLGEIPATGDIRKIKIEIRARTSQKDPNYNTNDGYRTFTLTSHVTPRNLAY